MKQKKWMVALTLCAAVALFASACAKNSQPEETGSREQQSTQSVQPEKQPDGAEAPEAAGQTGTESTQESAVVELRSVLDDIDENATVGIAGSSLRAVQEAVKLLDWGTATGLNTEESYNAAAAWLSEKSSDEQAEMIEKLSAVDAAYQQLLTDDAEDAASLLSAAGCEDAAYPWSSAPVESIEAVMRAAGLRSDTDTNQQY